MVFDVVGVKPCPALFHRLGFGIKSRDAVFDFVVVNGKECRQVTQFSRTNEHRNAFQKGITFIISKNSADFVFRSRIPGVHKSRYFRVLFVDGNGVGTKMGHDVFKKCAPDAASEMIGIDEEHFNALTAPDD